MDNTTKRSFSNIKVLSWNICSFEQRHLLLLPYVNKNHIDVICLQETLAKKAIKLPGYTAYSCFKREGHRGITTFVRNSILSKRVRVPTFKTRTDAITVSLTLQEREIIITNIYHANGEKALDICKLTKKCPNYHLIVGDFNCHHSLWGVNNDDRAEGVDLLEEIFNTENMSVLNTGEPTRKSGYSMDLSLVTSDLAIGASWKVDERLMSDHYACITTLEEEQVTPPPPEPRYNLKKANWELFNTTFSNMMKDKPNHTFEQFKIALSTALEVAVPKTKGTYVQTKRWWYNTPVCKAASRRVNIAHRTLRKFRTYLNFIRLRLTIKIARIVYARERDRIWQSWVEEINEHTTLHELWRKVNILKGKIKTPLRPNPQAEADKLAIEFTSRTKRSNLPLGHIKKLDQLEQGRIDTINLAKNTPSLSQLDSDITIHEVNRHLANTKNKAPGSDRIPVQALKNLDPQNRIILTNVLNNIYQTSEIPEEWKQGHIVPIPKPNTDAQRPITLLQTTSKLMEKVVRDRLVYSTKVANADPPAEQFGFRPFRSSQQCYLTKINHLLNALEFKKGIIVVYLDLEKAFELVDHTVLLEALAVRGVQGKVLTYISEYLNGRSARVAFQGAYSDFLELENGVPQGGILSPTIFNMVIAEIHALQLPFTRFISYADDIAMIVSVQENTFSRAQTSLNALANKCAELGLKISPSKTKAMQYFAAAPEKPLILGSQVLEWVTNYKYLGVVFDYKLNFHDEIKYLISRMNARINLLRNVSGKSFGANARKLKSLYLASVRSLVDFAAPAILTALPNKINKGNIDKNSTYHWVDKMETIQNTALRSIISAPRLAKIVLMRREAEVLPLVARIYDIGHKTYISMGSSIDSYLGNAIKEKHDQLNNNIIIKTKNLSTKFNLLIRHGHEGGARLFEPPNTSIKHPLHHIQVNTFIEHNFTKKNLSPIILNQIAKEQMYKIKKAVPHLIDIYTDGSVMPENGRSGSAAYNPLTNEEVGNRVRDYSSTLSTELIAIKLALKKWNIPIVIHSDSMGAIQVIRNTFTHNKLAIQIQELIRQRREKNIHTLLHWIPSHCKILGNDRADLAAKTAANYKTITLHTKGLSKQQAKNKISKISNEFWDNLDKQDLIINPISNSRDWYKLVTENIAPVSPDLHKNLRHVATRFRLGHRRWSDTPEYTLCSCEIELFGPAHILTSCPLFNYTAIQKLINSAMDSGPNLSKTELAIKILKLAAAKKYVPLAKFYKDNENLLW